MPWKFGPILAVIIDECNFYSFVFKNPKTYDEKRLIMALNNK